MSLDTLQYEKAKKLNLDLQNISELYRLISLANSEDIDTNKKLGDILNSCLDSIIKSEGVK